MCSSDLKAKFGGVGISDAKRRKTLKDENGCLKTLLTEAIMDSEAFKAALEKSGQPAAARRAKPRFSKIMIAQQSTIQHAAG